jgi:CheY-like chemotaxis protein
VRAARRVSPRNFLAGLSPDHFDIFRQLMTPVTFEDGATLFAQGDAARSAWFVDEGHVALSVRLPGGAECPLAAVGPGEVLGELALMSDVSRTATARAVGPVRALEVDRKDFQGMLTWFQPASFAVLRRLALLVAERLRETTTRIAHLHAIDPPPAAVEPPWDEARRGCAWDWRAFLPALPFFESFTAADIDRFVELTGGRVWSVPRGTTWLHEGAPATGCHLLLRGAVERRLVHHRRSRRIEVISPGRVVGETAMLLERDRAARSVAREDTVSLEIPGGAFAALTGEARRVSFRFLGALTRGIIERLCRANRLVSRLERERYAGAEVPHADEVSSEHLWAERGASADVLVVDDSPMNRAVLRAHLEAMGHAATEAADGVEALALLGRRRFDAILLDVTMPRMDGYETLARLKASPALQAIPVVMITAVEGLDSAVRCLRLGAEDYLPRVLDAGALRARLDACLGRG